MSSKNVYFCYSLVVSKKINLSTKIALVVRIVVRDFNKIMLLYGCNEKSIICYLIVFNR